MQTRAAVLRAIGQPLRIETLTLPDLRPGQVRVHIACAGVCGSQLNEVRGRKGPDRYLPHALGHEGTGTIDAVGDGVTKVKVGDRVVLTWLKGTGAEVLGTVYASPGGPVNAGPVTTFMEHAVVSESRVVPIAGDFPAHEAVLLGCAVPTGAGIVAGAGRLRRGDTVAVFGAGGVGLAAILAARAEGAAMVIAVDLVAGRLTRAAEAGATDTVNAAERDAVSAVRELTGGQGVDLAIEAVGSTEASENALACVRDGGGTCIIAGNPPPGSRFRVDPFDLIRGRRLLGSWGGGSDPDRDIPRFVERFRQGTLPIDRMIGPVYPLADINRAFDDMEAGRAGRAVIEMRPAPPRT